MLLKTIILLFAKCKKKRMKFVFFCYSVVHLQLNGCCWMIHKVWVLELKWKEISIHSIDFMVEFFDGFSLGFNINDDFMEIFNIKWGDTVFHVEIE